MLGDVANVSPRYLCLMARETAAQLRARIDQLEAENAALRSDEPVDAPKAKRRSWGWTLLATVLIVIGALLAPIAVVGTFINLTLTDTDRFVAAYAPLADDPAVQRFVTTEAVAAISEQVDIPALTSDVIDGIIELGTGPIATKALETLKGPAAQGIQSLIESKVGEFVASDAFSTVFSQALRVSHSQLVSVMQGNPDGVVQLGDRGEIGIQLAPIIAEIKTVLVAQGLTFASQIPEIDRTIVVAQSDLIPTVQVAYNLAVIAGFWLTFVALAFLIAGVLVARRRSIALIWAAVALALSMALTLAALGTGSIIFVSTVSPGILPSAVASIIFATVTGSMQASAIAVLVLAIVVAIVGWIAGPFSVPRKLRGLAQSGAAGLRDAAEKRGLTTGRVGEWLYRQKVLLRVAVAVIASVIVLLVRPLTPGLIIWTLVVSVIVLWLLEVLQRPVVTVPAAEEL